MSKYIDADLLKKEIKRLEKAAHKSALGCADSETRKFHEGKDFAYQNVGVLIYSLQQEQPKVDLEEEIEDYWIATGWSKVMTLGKFRVIARYFYGLGQLNSR
jgi:hypothetical protein